ncbi:MAG: TraR/DksA family transcriptional regulator [Syntrophobacteraceae bacterium]
MKNDALDYFRNMLENRRRELIFEGNALFAEMERGGDSEDPKDIVDMASSQYAGEFTLRFQHRNRKLIREIMGALSRIEDGEFGVCEECGDDIGVERLKVQPMATLCVGCKRKLEVQSRLAAIA